MMADEHKKDLTAAQAAVASKSTALDLALKTINDLTIGQDFTSSTFITTELVLTPRVARQVYGDHFEIEDGQTVGYNKPKGAEGRTKLVDASGDALPFDDAMKKLVEAAPDKDQLMRSKLKTGAQSTTTNGIPVRKSSDTAPELFGMAAMQAALNKGALKKSK
jgi:hypothetical protein